MEETVAHDDDLSLPFGENGLDIANGLVGGELSLDLRRQAFVTADDVDIGQWIAVTVYVDGFVERDLRGKLLLGSKVHEDLIRYPHLTARKNPLKFHRDFCRNCRYFRYFRRVEWEIHSLHRCGRGKGEHFHRPKQFCG